MREKSNFNTGTKILIVEDSPTLAEQLKHIFEQQGHSVLVAKSGREAIDSINKHKPTLVISDIIMPEMDGYELCRKIKANEKFKDIPVILVTTLSNPSDILEGLKCGANHFITKPYNEQFLLSRIRYILANQELRKQSSAQVGIEIYFDGQKHFVTAERFQIIDLLVSTFDTAIQKNLELEQLQDANDVLTAQKQELHALALRDELTGLYNRRGLLTLAQQQLKFAMREKRMVSLLFVDIDDLKRINDTFGHQEGDKALINTSKILLNTFRKTDIVARIGGDEFVVAMTEFSDDDARNLIERLKKNLDHFNSTQKEQRYNLSLSIGVASCDPKKPSSIEALIQKADEALYEYKQRKRE